MVDGIFGLFALGCGLYCLYGYYMVKFKNEINRTILLPKDVDVKKCRDYRGYCKEAQFPLLLLGVMTSLYGAVDLFNTYVGGADQLFMVMLVLMVVTLVIYVIQVRKINRKYFGV